VSPKTRSTSPARPAGAGQIDDEVSRVEVVRADLGGAWKPELLVRGARHGGVDLRHVDRAAGVADLEIPREHEPALTEAERSSPTQAVSRKPANNVPTMLPIVLHA